MDPGPTQPSASNQTSDALVDERERRLTQASDILAEGLFELLLREHRGARVPQLSVVLGDDSDV